MTIKIDDDVLYDILSDVETRRINPTRIVNDILRNNYRRNFSEVREA
jgi:hypothetical protein